MRSYAKKMMTVEWDILVLSGYYLMIFLTLYAAPKLWSLCVGAFDSPVFFIADLTTFVIFSIFLVALTYQDVFNKGMMDLFRYFVLIIIGLAILITLQSLSNPFERLCIPEYALVCYITFRIASRYTRTRAIYVWTFVIVAAFACIEELMQFFLPNRSFDVSDIFMDIWSGTLTLFVIGLALRPKLKDSALDKIFRESLYYFYMNRKNIWLKIKNLWFDVESRITDFLFP